MPKSNAKKTIGAILAIPAEITIGKCDGIINIPTAIAFLGVNRIIDQFALAHGVQTVYDLLTI
jgi:hypothetical protein